MLRLTSDLRLPASVRLLASGVVVVAPKGHPLLQPSATLRASRLTQTARPFDRIRASSSSRRLTISALACSVCLLASGLLATAQQSAETPLHTAARTGNIDTVRLLLDKGAAIDARTERLETPLLFAAANGHAKVVALLVDKLAGINITDLEGYTPLLLAAKNGHLETVTILLDNGANPNAGTNSGDTAVFYAVKRSHLEMLKALHEMGGVLSSLNNDGESPLSIARKLGNKEILTFLEKNNARIPPPPTGEKNAGQ